MFKYICRVFSLITFCAVFNLIISSPSANKLPPNSPAYLARQRHGELDQLPRPRCASVAVVHSPRVTDTRGDGKRHREDNLETGLHGRPRNPPTKPLVEYYGNIFLAKATKDKAGEEAGGQQAVLRKHPIFETTGTLKTSHSTFQRLMDLLSFSSSC